MSEETYAVVAIGLILGGLLARHLLNASLE